LTFKWQFFGESAWNTHTHMHTHTQTTGEIASAKYKWQE